MVMVDTNSQTTKTVEWRNITVGATSDSQQIVCANAGPVTLDAAPGGELLLGYITIKMENISSGEVLYNGTLSDFSSYTFTVDESNMIQYTLYLLSADNSCKNKNLTFVIKVAGLDADTVVISTANVSINMNNGAPILSQYEFEYWNGITEEFFIENDSTVPVYARLYLDNVSGSLADSVTVSVYDGDTNLGAVWNKGAGGRLFAEIPNVLRIWERKDLTVTFSVESGAHGEMQFQLACDIVQTTNNPGHIYDGKFTNSGSTALNIIHQMAYFEHFRRDIQKAMTTVTFVADGNPYTIISVTAGSAIEEPIPPEVTGVLTGWSTDEAGTNLVSFPYTPTADITLYAKVFSKTLEESTWEEIAQISANKQWDAVGWQVGDSKTITLNGTVGTLALNNYQCKVYIIGFDHNSGKEGQGISFGMLEGIDGKQLCLVDQYYDRYLQEVMAFSMNTTRTNAGGWKASKMRKTILGSTDVQNGDATPDTIASPAANTLMAALPADLRAVLKPITKYTDNVGKSSDASAISPTIDYLPLMAEFEVFGVRTNANPNEETYQVQYEYYKSGNSKKKYKQNNAASAAKWWLRSPNSSLSDFFCSVFTDGTFNNSKTDYSLGVAPAFLV